MLVIFCHSEFTYCKKNIQFEPNFIFTKAHNSSEYRLGENQNMSVADILPATLR